ncbi:hypothetical protein TRFO_07268 [Tritrichomonas foetus]|uniref:Uncharacterized protein n=1 Tax=Tritrichomonas foetus TaxID=1144522 RepID=A0A1J4JX25_9EUKA|nr:hypothetical protein TRFO_07268 [Tritrichomonas foetus]|eukprot:OHT02084.1 hypothetical protein TRFO_07268 [Tritrichomonas foetus]
MMKFSSQTKTLIDFTRIGTECRRLQKNSSAIETAALIINHSVSDPKISLDKIIYTQSYQSLLKIVMVLYRRFSTDANIHLRNLLSLVHWSDTIHLGEYSFIQTILSTDIKIEGEQINLIFEIFPTLIRPILLSRIYSKPESLFVKPVKSLELFDLPNSHFLQENGMNTFLIKESLVVTYQQSLQFFYDLLNPQTYRLLNHYLSSNPNFFTVVYSICQHNFFDLISGLMEDNLFLFLSTFVRNYKNMPKEIFQCIYNHLDQQIIENYACSVGSADCSNFIHFIFENDFSTHLENISCGTKYINKALTKIYRRYPNTIFHNFKQNDVQRLNDFVFDCIISTSDIYQLHPDLIEGILSKPRVLSLVRHNFPKFLELALNRCPNLASNIASIIHRRLRNKLSPNALIVQRARHEESNNNYEFEDDKRFERDDRFNRNKLERFDVPAASGIATEERRDFYYQLALQIYQIDERLYLHCFQKSKSIVFDLLSNFLPPRNHIYELNFPTKQFFDECEKLSIDFMTDDELIYFFEENLVHIFHDKRWIALISSTPLLFYSFTRVLIQNQVLQNHNSLVVLFASNMLPTFKENSEKYLEFMYFLQKNQGNIEIKNFPLYLRIKLVEFLNQYYENTSSYKHLFILFCPDISQLLNPTLNEITNIESCVLDAFDLRTKIQFYTRFIEGNLQNPILHKTYIMLFNNYDRFVPFHDYFVIILNNQEEIESSLEEDPIYFNKWFNYITSPGPWQQILNEGSFECRNFIGKVMFSCLKYPEFSTNFDFIDRLILFLNTPENTPPLNIVATQSVLKVVLTLRKNVDNEIRDRYCTIFDILMNKYFYKILRAVSLLNTNTNMDTNMNNSKDGIAPMYD